MMKKLISSALLAVSVAKISLAATIAFNGPYLGASLGGMAENVSTEGSFVENSGSDTTTLSSNGHLNRYSGIAAIFAGYAKTWQTFFAATEVFVNLSQYQIRHTVNDVHDYHFGPYSDHDVFDSQSSITASSWQYGLDLRPGFLATPSSVFYGRLGMTMATLKMTSHFSNTSTEYETNDLGSSAHSRHALGWRVGAGIATNIAPQWNIGLDYIFTYYGTVSTVGNLSNADGNFSNSLHAKLMTNALMLRIEYFLN